MKLISKVFIIIVLILTINKWFAIEKSSIILESNPLIENTDKNINQANLIENEVVIFKNKLTLIQKKYNLENDFKINKSKKKLWYLIYILRKIQTTKVNKNTADIAIKDVINDLKIINFETKSYLKKIKQDLYNTQIYYRIISKKLNNNLNKITIAFIKYYNKKEKLNLNDKEIIKIVQNIYIKSIKLEKFKLLKFYNKKDMKKYLTDILRDLKQDFKKIKNINKKR